MNKILLVEDDREISASLKELLEMEAFEVVAAYDGEQALKLLDDSIDVILLDIMMPKKNGIETLKELRKNYKTPVIMLTARDTELDQTLSFELGADQYHAKPFKPRTLIAQIGRILQSHQPQNEDQSARILKVEGLELNPGRQEASFHEKVLDLTGTEFTLLYLLAERIGQVVSREELSEKVLGKRLTPFDRAIDMHVSNLRRKLPGREDGGYHWFKTLRGRGYLMVAKK